VQSRRVKCDETKPQCQRCVRAGRSCDGYGKDVPRGEGKAGDEEDEEEEADEDVPKQPPNSPLLPW
jgi:hypothetical protein